MSIEDLDVWLRRVPDDRTFEGECSGGPPVGIDDGLLLAYHAGALSEADTQEVEAHLAGCADCRDLLTRLTRPVSARSTRRALDAIARARGGQRAPPGRASPRSRRARAGLWLTLSAMAAGVAWMVWPPASLPLVPEYTLQGPLGGVQRVRADTLPTRIFDASSTVELILRPASDLQGPAPAVGVFIRSASGPRRPVPRAYIHSGEGGAVYVQGPAPALFGDTPGPQTIEIAFAASPSTIDEIDRHKTNRSTPGVRWLETTVTYQGHRTSPKGPGETQ